MSKTRHYFPGNNTPQGFFSYYRHLLSQREAKAIYYLKGGPGTGKSTFFRRIGMALEAERMDVDYLHCSADVNSLDGILIPEKAIALIDGTSPHILDPVTPGAVDRILNLGEFWDEKAIKDNKEEIMEHNDTCSRWYRIGYSYLKTAGAIEEMLSMVQEEGIASAEIYQLASDIIQREFQDYEIRLRPGRIKKAFATAVTPGGLYNGIKDILADVRKIYFINVPEGYRNQSLMQVLLEGAKYRGFDIECYYCSMNPSEKAEHLIIPDLSLAFITTSCWHDVEPWELTVEEGASKDITLIDLCDYQSFYFIEDNKVLLRNLSSYYENMLESAVYAFSKAKENHDAVEAFYTNTMDFHSVNLKADEILSEILG